MEKLLIVDDNEDIRKQLKWGLSKDYQIMLAANVAEALAYFTKHRPSVITLDLGLPPFVETSDEGFRCLTEMLKIDPSIKVIVISGNDERVNALKSIEMGAYDFIQKPVNLDELKVILSRAFQLHLLENENKRLQGELKNRPGEYGGILGQCSEMQTVFSTIRKIAASDVAVMINGESGTGKELVARAIHSASLRSGGPFIPINCGAIPDNLLEAELFGHEKGAFTGAMAKVQGKFEYADKGTLFLDEIGELPPPLQVKLLRFLQEKLVQRVGGREDIPVDARIIAATNIDITKAMSEGAFREDLYYRISVVTLELPPLRSRGEDIALLATFFLRKFNEDFRKKVRGYSASAMDALRGYTWPGNVRELENKVQRAVLMATGNLIEPEDLGFTPQTGSAAARGGALTLREARERLEIDLIRGSLSANAGNIAKAADDLGVSRPTLYDLIKKYSIEV
ncbi:PEP-CTERM-box response regulator transcription factor [Geobacter pelophilus]|jgi:two-component system NtrC family response regulator|uniref:PEP-CTERM-box response regulator transcription factor n=1 Tax=Geoanaerobacter pelophilus TaxID=60036 RepID=A0AAW4KZ35_9BACT|nr:PEP-CTERM-box response regulator transcription factor [Geoanaerobacter pelophilus]MBT0662805.1 PEP-CTERM-box response regulator transcription factor [Geoanaerobacter pelophilus]